MAHYIAELIHAAENATEQARAEAEARCATAIMELWDHRATMPNGARPFEELEPLIETLKAIDPNAPNPFYRRSTLRKTEEADEESEVARHWLSLARGVDDIARMLIDHALAQAAEAAADKAKEWVALARSVSDDSVDIEFITHILDRVEPSREAEAELKRLHNRLERLDWFLRLVLILRTDFDARRAEIEAKVADEGRSSC